MGVSLQNFKHKDKHLPHQPHHYNVILVKRKEKDKISVTSFFIVCKIQTSIMMRVDVEHHIRISDSFPLLNIIRLIPPIRKFQYLFNTHKSHRRRINECSFVLRCHRTEIRIEFQIIFSNQTEKKHGNDDNARENSVYLQFQITTNKWHVHNRIIRTH